VLGALLIGALNAANKLVEDEEHSNAAKKPEGPLELGVGGKAAGEAGEDHDDVPCDGHEDVAGTEAGEGAKVEQKKGCGYEPVDVAAPVNVAVEVGLMVH